ncbi:MAG: Crp/Fnr family transcriptional regulator [Cyclobacteriaceae bacterium]|nr:Crp/Fnr family transcriptional regulator [Cyclobacteriaceae bacterium]
MLTEDDLKQLPDCFKTKTYLKGEFLVRPGDRCKNIFFIEKGLVRQFTIDSNDKEHIIHFSPENFLVSDRSSAYFNQPTEFFIEALEDTVVYIMDENFINKASDVSKLFREFNHRALHNNIRVMQKRINHLLTATAEERYLEFVKTYPSLYQRVPQWMIASYLGVTPEGLSRVRKELTRKHPKLR